MAWASTDLIPTSINVNALFSNLLGTFNDLTVIKLSPRNSSNALFDFTAASAASLNFNSGLSLPGFVQVAGSIAPTIVAHDATGLTISITPAQLDTIFSGLGATNPPITVTATDGTTVLQVANGSANLRLVA